MQRPLVASLILSQNGDNVPISVKDVMVSKRGLGKLVNGGLLIVRIHYHRIIFILCHYGVSIRADLL